MSTTPGYPTSRDRTTLSSRRRFRSPAIGTGSETGAAGFSPRPEQCASPPTRSSPTPGCPTAQRRMRLRFRSRNYPEEALVFLLASRYCDSDRLLDVAWTALRPHPAGLGAGPGYLRFRACAHRVQLPARAPHAHSLGSLRGAARRVPRLCPPCHRLLPLR